MAVPFARTLHRRGPGRRQKGRDVRAIQHTLKKMGLRKTHPTGRYGRGTWKAVRKFQRKHGLRDDGVYGPATHAKMQRHFDHQARNLYRSYIVVRVCLAAAAHAGDIHYRQLRPMPDMAPYPNFPNYTDCSQFLTWAFKSAGLPDPSGLDYSGYGNTVTQVAHGRRVSDIRNAKEGLSAVFYGRSSTLPSHVAVYIGKKRLWYGAVRHVVVSMGSEPGPFTLRYDYRHDRVSVNVYD